MTVLRSGILDADQIFLDVELVHAQFDEKILLLVSHDKCNHEDTKLMMLIVNVGHDDDDSSGGIASRAEPCKRSWVALPSFLLIAPHSLKDSRKALMANS